MCLAVPMRILEIRADGTGVTELDGARHEADFSLVEEPRAGDYVIVHAGCAIAKLDEKEAAARLALFREMADAWRARPT